MVRTHTRLVDFRRLLLRGDSAALPLKLMVACNDMQLANEALGVWKKPQPPSKAGRAEGARAYFVRLQAAHLCEALGIIEDILKSDELMEFIEGCDQQTRDSLDALRPYLRGGEKHQWFINNVVLLRNNLTFHYDSSGKRTMRALAHRASSEASRFSTITRGSTAFLWHFRPADDIVDSIFVRQIWNVPDDADIRSAVDEVLAEIHAIFLKLTDFSGEFLWRYGAEQ